MAFCNRNMKRGVSVAGWGCRRSTVVVIPRLPLTLDFVCLLCFSR